MSSQHWYRAVGAIGLAAAVMAGCASVPRPTEQLAVSNSAITNAASAGGTEYAPVEMAAARDKMSRANQAMATENYEVARRLAEEAQVDARLAEKKAESAQVQEGRSRHERTTIRVLREEINRKSK